MAKKWTEDDDIYLEYFIFSNDEKIQESADFLGRSVGAIYTRLYTLRQNNASIQCSRKRWTAQEKNYLKNNYLRMTVEQMARRLGKTKSGVAYQMRQLGLRKVKSIKFHDKELRRLAAEGYYGRQASRMLGISNSSLTNYCKMNNIKFRKATGIEQTANLKEMMQREYLRHAFNKRKESTK